MTSFEFKQYFQNLTRKDTSYWNLNKAVKQELDIYEINKFQSISWSGRTYPLNIPHGRMIILYRSIHNYLSIEDNTFLKERGMWGPYNTSAFPYYYCHCSPLLLLLCPCCPHIIIIVPHRSPLLLLLCPYIIIVLSTLIILWPLRLLYIERRSCHFYDRRIVNLCNVKEVFHLEEVDFEVVDLSFLIFCELVA